MQKIATFYHVHKTNNWHKLFMEQIHRLCASGLYKVADFVHIGVNGPDLSLPMSLPKFKPVLNKVHTDEIDTLTSLYEFCVQNQDYKVLYFHTKGITKHDTDLTSLSWRLYMEYVNINRWEECVNALNDHDCAGTEGLFGGFPDTRQGQPPGTMYDGHYSGNFWWARADYIAKLDVNYMVSPIRYREKGEIWIGTKDPKPFNYFSTNTQGGHLYYHLLSPEKYMVECK